MTKGVFGRKVGMTQVFDEKTGDLIGATVVQLGPCVVVRKKSVKDKEGYSAIVVGFGEARTKEVDGQVVYRISKPDLGVYKKAGLTPMRSLHEIRVTEAELAKYEIGQKLDISTFNVGDRVDVAGTSKGRGFAGVMKRHHMGGSRATQGTHEFFRHGGAISTNTTPAHILKGKRMAGHMGNENVSVLNMRIMEILADDQLILLRGSVPGAPGGEVLVRMSVKGRR